MPSAAVVVIGNEILTGKFADENGPYLIARLRALGADLRRLVTIPDDLAVIAAEVRHCADRHDFVLTTGGVGPTHDDLTLEGIARAFEVPLEQRPELVALLERFELPSTEATLRMATVPQGAELIESAALAYPVVRVRNVYVFPGVPKLLKNKFEAISDRFAGEAVATARVFTDEHEFAIADRLTAVAARHPEVDIGSYPRFGEGDYRVILTLESRDPSALARARDELCGAVRVVRVEGASGG